MASPVISTHRQGQPGALDRITALAARLLDCHAAAVVIGARTVSSTSNDHDLTLIAGAIRERTPNAALWIRDARQDAALRRLSTRFRFCATAPIDGWDGKPMGVLIVADREPREASHKAQRHLNDLASLASDELEFERKRSRHKEQPEERRTQEQLLDKTLELTKFSEDLRQIHRLSTSSYADIEQMFSDYLETGLAIFGLATGVITQVRGRYGVVVSAGGASPPRKGATMELDRQLCGLVVEDRHSIASVAVEREPRLSGRSRLGPAPPHSYAGALILLDEEPWGVLSFSAPHRRWREFTSHEVELLELMAKSIGRSLLERRMLAGRKQAEILELDRSQILEMVAKNAPMEEVMGRIAGLVERQAPTLAATVHLVDQATDERTLSCAAHGGMPPEYRGRMQRLPTAAHEGCCFSAAVTRRLEIVADAYGCGQLGAHHQYCWQAGAGLPILSGSGELLGLLAVYWRIAIQPRHIDSELLEMAAQLAAIAIEHRRLTDRLEFQAQHDVLTGLPSRVLFTATLQRAIDDARSRSTQVAVVFIDLDRFKQINDHWGHAAGDLVLRETARRLNGCLRPGEIAGRLGGDEFVAMLTGVQSKDEAVERSKQVLEAVRAPIGMEDQSLVVTASVGLSLYPQSLHSGGAHSAEDLLASADQAMYQAKNNGKNTVLLSNAEANGARATSLQLEHSLRQALRDGEFRLYFQPVFDIREGAGIALEELEVLLGWDHPQLGCIGPAQFIPIAEECGMIAQIGAWVLREACRQSADWRSRGLRPVRLAVNVSPLQFDGADFVELVEAALAETALPASALELELTESAILKDIHGALPKLERLRQLGVRLTLDDFGTGYSALSYLRWMPVSSLKIDRSFVAEMATSAHTRTLVQAIVALAHNMALTVVAEGVETARQFELLMQLGCDYGQGHLLAEPLPVEEMERWLVRESAG